MLRRILSCVALAACITLFFGCEGNKQASPADRLIEACLRGKAEDVRAALKDGADVNRPHFGPGGVTPLMFAAARNPDPEVTKALIAAGADMNAKNASGETVLMFAVLYNDALPVLDALLAAKPDLNAQDRRGETALHKVVSNKRSVKAAERLLLAGANGELKDGSGDSAFRIAWIEGYYDQSPIITISGPEVFIEYSGYREAERQRAAAGSASGEDDTEGQGDEPQDDDVDPYVKYGDDPGVLPKEARETPAVSENAGIDLKRYNVDNPENILPRLDAPATFAPVSDIEMPVLDGALGSFPLYSAFAKACYGGVKDAFGKPISLADTVVQFNNTVNGLYRLVWRNTDIFFGMEPGNEQKAFAEKTWKREFVLTPFSREAFVFFVHKDNPISSLTVEQLKGIYSGAITNWKEVGGPDMPVLAFQRNEGSGSQSGLERFMGDTPLREPLVELDYDTMEGIFSEVADYRNVPGAIGFSYYFFASNMVDNEGVKLLAVNGIAPSNEHIRDKSYPLNVYRYAVTLKDNGNPAVAAFLQWLQGPQGQEIVKKLGYVPLEE